MADEPEKSIFEDPYADDDDDVDADGDDGEEVYESMVGDIQQEIILGDDDVPPSDDDDDDGDYANAGAEGEEEEEGEPMELPPMHKPDYEFKFHTDSVYSVSFHNSDSTILATGGGDDLAFICSTKNTEEPLHKLSGHTDTVIAAKFSHDGKYLATAAMDATINIWDPATGNQLHTFDGPGDSIDCFVWHQRGPVLFAGGGDGTGWLWNAQAKQTLNVFTGHAGAITDALFTPDGKRIVTVSDDVTLRVWDPKTAACVHTIQGYGFHGEGITNVSCHAESHMCASGGTDTSAFLCNIQTGKPVGELRGHEDAVEATSFVNGFPWVVTGSLDGKIGVFDLNTLQARLWMTNEHGVTRLVLDGLTVWAADVSGAVTTWDARAGGKPVATWQAHHDPILSLSLSADKSLFATSSDDKTARVFSTKH
jgi:ribosome assembly protein SQT1